MIIVTRVNNALCRFIAPAHVAIALHDLILYIFIYCLGFAHTQLNMSFSVRELYKASEKRLTESRVSGSFIINCILIKLNQ
jgi:hypothetical protein